MWGKQSSFNQKSTLLVMGQKSILNKLIVSNNYANQKHSLFAGNHPVKKTLSHLDQVKGVKSSRKSLC